MRKKVLFISSRPMFPITDGYRIRTSQQLNLLCENFDVDVLYLTPDGKEDDIREYVPKVGKIYVFQISRWKHYLLTLRFLFNKLPLQVNYYHSPKAAKKVASIIENYDAVFCNNIRTAEYGMKTPVVRYMDFVDAISMNYEKARRQAHGLKKLIYSIDYKRCRAYERKCMLHFNRCAIISDIDKKYIQELTPKPVSTVGNMVEIPPIERITAHTSPRKIVFVGRMAYEPNIVAVTYFAHKIFPELRKTFPDLEFVIVGASPHKKVKKLAEIEGVTVTGFVESIEPYFKDATVVVAPMLTGAGVQNKIIQAMAFSCCVATTPIGAEGLHIKKNEISIFKSDQEWIEGMTELIHNRERRIRKGEKARQYVLNNLTLKNISSQFNTFIKRGGLDW